MKYIKKYFSGLEKRIFTLRYLLYYSMVLVIPLFIVLFIYFDVSKTAERDTYEAQLSLISQSSKIVDKNLFDMKRIVVQIKSNLSINQFFRVQNPLVDLESVSDVRNIQTELLSYSLSNDYFDEICIYSQKSGFLITSLTSVLRLDNYYNNLYKIDGMTFNQWVSNFLNKNYNNCFLYNVPIITNKNKENYLVYADSVPRNGDNNVSNIFIFINNNKILNLFKEINQPDKGWLYISDNKGNIITQSKTMDSKVLKGISSGIVNKSGYFIKKINGVSMFVTYVKSEFNGFNYVSAVTLSSIKDKTKNIKNLLGGLTAITFIVGIFMAVALAYRCSRPINRIISLLSNSEDNEDIKYDFTFIDKELQQMINNNQSMKKELLAQLPAQKISIFYRLLNGEMIDKNEVQQSFNTLGIEISDKYYAVVIVSINDVSTEIALDVISAYKVIVNKLMASYMPSLMGTYDIDFYKQAVIIKSSQSNYIDFIQVIENMANKVYDELVKTSNIYISFSGSIADDIMKVYLAYYEAKVALNYKETLNNFKVSWYKERLEKSNLFFKYPLDMESKLMEAIINGKVRECKALLTNLYKTNFIQNKLSYTINIQLLNSIISTIFRASEKLPEHLDKISEVLQQFTKEISRNPDVTTEFNKIKSFLIELCKEISEIKDNQSTTFINKIMEHINKNYCDCQMSLSSVGVEFGITEIYLSRFFKEQTGENFSKYIERLRMEKAQELLSTQKLRICSIVEKVGYNSTQVFRRVYKRYYGKSPTQYNKD